MFEKPTEEVQKSERERFDEQYDHPEKITLEDGEFFIHDVIPENLKFPIPTLFAPGITEDPINGKETVFALFKEGRRVLLIDAPHGIPAEPVDGISAVELRKAMAILKTAEIKGITGLNVVAHSEGAINSSFAAKLDSEKFQNMIFVDPAGMIGKDNIFRLIKGNFRELIRGAKANKENPPEFNFKANPERARLYFRQTLLQTLKEVYAISQSDIRDLIRDLKASGIGISVIHSVDDKMFPMEKMQDGLTAEDVDGFYSIKGKGGGHQEIINSPTAMGKLINKALEALENRHAGEEVE